ncbi:hypothetical protein KAI32_02150 [Candidatus Pacearchaeota archaeon]|nr:hypothetical protein [Candidatus Pacearchaeota archaeon]
MALQWIIIGILVLLGFLIFKMDHHIQLIKSIIIVLIGLLFYLSMVGILSSDQVDLTSPQGIVQATYLYFGWIGETTSKLWDIGTETTNLVGNAIKVNNSYEDKLKR